MNERPRRINSGWHASMVGVVAGVACFVVLLMVQRKADTTLSIAEAAGDSDRFWPVDHPLLTALIVFVVVAIGVRLYLFMRRLEDRS